MNLTQLIQKTIDVKMTNFKVFISNGLFKCMKRVLLQLGVCRVVGANRMRRSIDEKKLCTAMYCCVVLCTAV